MAEAVRRTQYWNVATNTVRTGATGHGESLDDIEHHLFPLDRARGSALHSWGVARGLEVSAAVGTPGVTVAPGTALDAAGRTTVLAPGSAAVTDPAVHPDAVQDVPTVVVSETGVTVDTAPASAGAVTTVLLTLTWREAEAATGGLLVLRHAPWLRLVPQAGFADRGDQVVLARVALDAAGAVTDLTPGPRRLTGVPTGRLELRVPTAGPGSTGQAAAASLAAEPGGDVVLSLLGGPAPVPALRITAASGDARLHGSLSVGPVAQPQQRPLQVEGHEIHSGGHSGGYSFADRTTGSFVPNPETGQRWVWYATGGEARLWSGEDVLKVRFPKSLEGSPDGAGFDVLRRMRVRSNGAFSAGVWFHQDRDRGFVGMGVDNKVGFYGADNAGWGFVMDTTTGNIGMGIGLDDPAARLHVNGSVAIRAAGRTTRRPPGGGPVFPPIFTRPGIGLDASGDVGIRSTGRLAAAQFNGNVSISGTLSKGGGGFTIDHPLEPGEKYLSHSFVESPEMTNLYTGRTTTGADGLAWVELPSYFEALNRDVTYQLTAIGGPAVLSIAEEVSGNRFAIRSDPAKVAVCWLVTGVRQDPWANANRIVPEAAKPDDAADKFLHPHAYGVAENRGIFGAAPDDESTE